MYLRFAPLRGSRAHLCAQGPVVLYFDSTGVCSKETLALQRDLLARVASEATRHDPVSHMYGRHVSETCAARLAGKPASGRGLFTLAHCTRPPLAGDKPGTRALRPRNLDR